MNGRRRLQKLFALLLAFGLVICLTVQGIADAGDFSGDLDWGGSDWGGSDWSSGDSGWDWDSGSDSNWGSSSWSSSNWSSSNSSDYDSSGSSGGWLTPIVFAILIYFIFFAGKGKGAKKPNVSAQPEPMNTLPLEELLKKDPNFNQQAFLEEVRNNYVKMQQAWESRDWEPMRAIMTDALFNQMKSQLDGLIKKGWINRVERIAVLDAAIRSYSVEGENDVLVVRLKTRITDYTVNENDELIKGSRTSEKFMTYDWKLVRNKDFLTETEAQVSTVSCPHCGAPLSVNQSARCEYCGSVITLTEHDWALSSIKGISQVTGNR